MFNTIIKNKTLQYFFAFTVAILTTGFLRLQVFSSLPNSDDGFYTFMAQLYYITRSNNAGMDGNSLLSMLQLYPFLTSWVFNFEGNQFIMLRLIDGFFAVITSVILFKVILKESGSTPFTLILMTTLLILMNYYGVIAYGFNNSIWIAYLPLFTALVVWQNSTKKDNFSFYLIGGLISFGVLLREPFLIFFILSAISVLIGYGWRALTKYLIGSALIGFSLLVIVLMFRGWDLSNFINSYTERFDWVGVWNHIQTNNFNYFGLLSIKNNWFILVTATLSLIYLIKLYCIDRKVINLKRFSFWLAVGILPLLEPMSKLPFLYHFAVCLPGLAGLTAMGWKILSERESKKIKELVLVVISLMSMIVILPTINKSIIKSPKIWSLSDAIIWVKSGNTFRIKQTIEGSQYLITAAKIYELSRKDSTLSISGSMSGLYPLTGLRPPTKDMTHLDLLAYDEDKLIRLIKKYRPTIIVTSHLSSYYSSPGDKALPGIVEKTNLYNEVGIIPLNLEINYGWKAGSIYRLKDFK